MNPAVPTRYQKHCPGCFRQKNSVAVCPHCDYDESAPRNPFFLSHGSILSNQYRVGRVLGRPGGFGITYLGWDMNLQQRVAIKEYLPREMAQRLPDSQEVGIHSAEDRRNFEFGKEQFLREARIVAKLDHPNIVRVRNFFNANGTAYLVMDYYEGISLGDYLSTVRSKLDPALAVSLVKPILDGLDYVHGRGVVHRDLKPHNIYLAAIGRPIVLDFGAARQAAGDHVQSMSVVLTEGYAPLEQYQRRAVQGPWTDVYGIAATLYRMITGAAPPIALDRIGHDPVEDDGWSAVPAALVPALRMALTVRPSDRYQTVVEFKAALDRYLSGVSIIPEPAEIMPLATPFVPPIDELLSATPSGATETTAVALDAAPTMAMPRPSIVGPALQAAGFDLAATPTRAERATRMLEPAPPPADPLTRNAFGVLPMPAGGRSERFVPRTTLYRRATDAAPPPVAAKPPHSFAPWLLVLVAAAAIGYVLLNPPEAQPPAVIAATSAPVAVPLEVAPAAREPLRLPDLVALPGGTVQLRESEAASASRTARISPLKMGRTEVTVAEFGDFVRRTGYENPRWQNYPCESAGGRLPDWQNPGYSQADNSPVVCVSWADANAYTQWLSRETGQDYRLPTEAEWLYAAKAGTNAKYWWGASFDAGMAACQSCPPKIPTQPSPAASFPPNPFGLYETLGNVREWTCSMFDRYGSAAAERCGTVNEMARVAVRGGSWLQDAETLAADHRESYEPYRRNVWTGFRVVQDVKRDTR